MNIAGGRIIGAEALVRWQDPDQGLIPPGRFIPLAEETGLIGAIGEWMLRETGRQGRTWREAGLSSLTLAVNLSARQIQRGDLAATVLQVLNETGFPADHLELELTESALTRREAEAVAILERLRGPGVRLAMDDCCAYHDPSHGIEMMIEMMNEPIGGLFGFGGWVAALVIGFGAVAVAGDVPSAVQSSICQNRSPCRVIETLDAGRSDDGARLTVLQVALGDDQPLAELEVDSLSCRPYPEEYWLQEVARDDRVNYRRLFAFCNDGYGAAGVGEDTVTVGPNRITLERAGGSAWRWEFAATYQLVPERPLSRRERSYHAASGGCLETETDYRTLTQRGWFAPPPPEEALGEETTFCDRQAAPGQFLGLPWLEGGDDDLVAKLEKQAAGLGDCALVLKAGGEEHTGFVIHGKPDPSAETEVRVLAPTANTLLVQIRDPGRTSAVSANWIHDDRLELWFGPSLYDGYPRAERRRELRQFGIRLADGAVFAGYGKPKALPVTRRWQRGDARLMLVDWSGAGLEPHAVTVVYGQGDGRQQGRMIATSALRYGDPDTLGQFWGFPANCELRDGVLKVGEPRSEAATRMENEDTASP